MNWKSLIINCAFSRNTTQQSKFRTTKFHFKIILTNFKNQIKLFQKKTHHKNSFTNDDPLKKILITIKRATKTEKCQLKNSFSCHFFTSQNTAICLKCYFPPCGKEMEKKRYLHNWVYYCQLHEIVSMEGVKWRTEKCWKLFPLRIMWEVRVENCNFFLAPLR